MKTHTSGDSICPDGKLPDASRPPVNWTSGGQTRGGESYPRPVNTGNRRIRAGIFLSIAVAMACIQTAAQAEMKISDHQPYLHDRFYTPGDGEPAKDFIGEAYDWSGVGKAGSKWVTMVSPSYFLSTEHNPPSGTVTFYAGNSDSAPDDTYEYTIESGQQISPANSPANQTNGTDLWLGKLTQPVDSTINSYPVLGLFDGSSAVDLDAYLGMELYNYGQDNRVGRNELDSIDSETVSGSTGMSMIFDYDDNDAAELSIGGDETWLRDGDSGGPSFTVWNGKLALLGIHWFATDPDLVNGDTPITIQSGDTFVPFYIGDVNLLMNGQSLTVVPEPGTISLGLLALIGLALLRKRLFGG